MDRLTPEALARHFHETYERLAPSFGYETRKDSAVPWEQAPERNRKLMIAVCKEIGPAAVAARDAEWREAVRATGVRAYCTSCTQCNPLRKLMEEK